jgi:superfamily II DNA or RNA helicase
MPNSPTTFTPGTFEYIEQKIRDGALGTEFGTDFEWLCRFFLLSAPKYKSLFKHVWLWNDWPDRWGPDKGIDLIAQTGHGKLWAIQGKAVHFDRTIPKSELDSFLSESNRPQFDYRLIIATTDDIGRNARDTIAGQEKPVGLVLRGELLAAQVRWPTRIGEQPRPLRPKKLRPHQARAVRDVMRGFRNEERGQIIMACGTGKTLTALWIAEKLASRRTLVLVPSLSLISQTLTEWGRNAAAPFDYLVVCSDETVVHRGDDPAITSTNELGVPVTTDVETIRQFLNLWRHKSAVVFATYQSSDRVAAAQASSAPGFDLVLADEAHRCTGPAEGLFTTVLDASKIKARHRLFMTATPRYFTGRVKKRAEELEYELASMDDVTRFGPVFHRLAFDAAIRADLLTNYQVVVIGVTQAEIRHWAEEARLVRTDDGIQTDARTLAAQIGLAKAMRRHDLRKIITFHSSVAKASRFTDPAFADSLVGVVQRMSPSAKPTGHLWTAHISGHTPAGRRATRLSVFSKLSNNSRGVLSNCACLGEGVDVPVLDGVAFIDPKRSMIDIIQAVGRVIRKAQDKRVGTVVIPVFVDESEDADHALSNSAFEPVWQVLKALRAHDEELAEELDELRLKLGKRSPYGGKIRLPEKIKVDVPTLLLEDFEQAFYVRIVEQTTRKPPLTEELILAWADAHHQRTNKWPQASSGLIADAQGETWLAVNAALGTGLRALPGNSSLAQLLAERRGVRNIHGLQPLTKEQILALVDSYYERTRKWPTKESGPVDCTRDEVWANINAALSLGQRGLPGGSSLAQLLSEKRGVRNRAVLPPLREQEILAWADEHYQRTGKWPGAKSGPIPEAAGESWAAVSHYLKRGSRGLRGGSSLALLLAKRRGVRNKHSIQSLTAEQILQWADTHHKQTGRFPKANSGLINGDPSQTWRAVDLALRKGLRGLSGGSSLALLLAEHRAVQNNTNRPSLSQEQILAWADAHKERTGKWPQANSGSIEDANETWVSVNAALAYGLRGLAAGCSLAKLLASHRQRRNIMDLPPLTTERILVWADTYHKRTGNWPRVASGRIEGASGETWASVNTNLQRGLRSLPGGSSLAQLLAEQRGARNPKKLLPLTVEKILSWADSYHRCNRKWPNAKAGAIEHAPGETWLGVDMALRQGLRGFPGGSSLARLIKQHRNETASGAAIHA